MKIFMLGWEFPPFISGGLGTACYGLTRAMSQLNMEVTFVLPRIVDTDYASHVKLLTPRSVVASEKGGAIIESYKINKLSKVRFLAINSPLQPYSVPDTYKQRLEEISSQKQKLAGDFAFVKSLMKCEENLGGGGYGGDMYSEVRRYADVAVRLAINEDFDIIHAHDWMTYLAGIAVAEVTGKPLVVQVHSTEFDRSGEHVNQMIYDIERRGMHAADKIIAVSNLTRKIIMSRYSVAGDKIEVVHNGVDRSGGGAVDWTLTETDIKDGDKLVLFLGRITMQKGPGYFLRAAKRVLDVMDNVKFIMAGSGDLMQQAIELSAELGIGRKVLFTGFLRGDDVAKIYKMADLFVMPSVSEPFGLVPLEALDNDVPVIISKQSGVAEVLTHALKVDFWDVEEMANKIVAVLKYPALKTTLQNHGNYEVRKLRWKDSAAKCAKIYENTLLKV